MSERRLSRAISEGDGISVIVAVDGPAAARAAAEAGAEALVIDSGHEPDLAAVREVCELPLLVVFRDGELFANADACIVDVHESDRESFERVRATLGDAVELAPRIRSEEHLEFVLEEFDPEVLVLSSKSDEPLAQALELLPDVPAGKLAIADVGARTRDEVVELERAGMDAVIVGAGNIAHLVGASPPDV